MVEINPLQLASQFQPKLADTGVIDKLKAGAALQGIKDRALGTRSTALNESNEFRAGLAQQLNTRAPTINTDITKLGEGMAALRGAQALNQARSGGVAREFPNQSFQLGQTPDQAMISGLPLKGQLANEAKLRSTQKAGTKVTQPKRQPDGSFANVETTQSAEQQATSKGNTATQQRVELIQSLISKKFQGANAVVVPPVDESSGVVMVSFDGADPVPVPITRPKK